MLYSPEEIAAVAELISTANTSTKTAIADRLARANLRAVGIDDEIHHPLPSRAVAAISRPLSTEVDVDLREFGDRMKADRSWWSSTECKLIDFLAG